MCVCIPRCNDGLRNCNNNNKINKYNILVMSGVRHCSVHTEFVALHLVELVPGVGVLAWADHRGSNVQVLVKVLPAHLTWTQTDNPGYYKTKHRYLGLDWQTAGEKYFNWLDNVKTFPEISKWITATWQPPQQKTHTNILVAYFVCKHDLETLSANEVKENAVPCFFLVLRFPKHAKPWASGSQTVAHGPPVVL